MRWADLALLALADGPSRSEVFTTTAGEHLLHATYDVPDGAVQQVIEVTVPRLALFERVDDTSSWFGTIRDAATGSSWLLDATPPASRSTTAAARALVRVRAGARGVHSEVVAVTSRSLRDIVSIAQCDAFLIDRDGALPTDPVAISAARMEAAGALLRAALAVPDDFDPDDFFVRTGLDNVEAMIEWAQRETWPTAYALDVVTEPSAGGTQMTFDLMCHVQIATSEEVDLRRELEAVQELRRALASSAPAQQEGPWPLRSTYPVAVLVPESFADDDDLPLGSGPAPPPGEQRRAARLNELNRRLRPVAVAVVVA